MDSKKYGNEVLDVIFGFGWLSNESTRGWYELRDSGVWVAKHDGHMDNLLFGEELQVRFRHPTGRWDSEPALPIPFTEAQFKDFLEANSLFTEAGIGERFKEDDGSLDQLELSRIRDFCPDAAELLELLQLPVDCRAALLTESATAIDYSMLADPDELVSAFGRLANIQRGMFTGKVQGPLLRAKKVKGVSGRKGAPPMFCPFEVMRWLTTEPKQNSGRNRIPSVSAARALRAGFPDVYEKYKEQLPEL